MVESVHWAEQTLTQLEGEDWGEPEWQSFVVTNSHQLRHKPLREFTAEDLRFMLGQQISLPILMPMALDVLELVDPFAGDNRGSLLLFTLSVDKRFWSGHRELWHRLRAVVLQLDMFREFVEQQLTPAAERFKLNAPGNSQETEPHSAGTGDAEAVSGK